MQSPGCDARVTGAAQPQAVPARELARFEVEPGPRQERRRGTQHERQRAQRPCHESGVLHPPHSDADVEASRHQVGDRLAALDVHDDIGALRVEVGRPRHQVGAHERRHGRHPHHAGGGPGRLARVVERRGELGQRHLAPRQQGHPFRRERHVPRRAREQAHLELRLEPGDVPADGDGGDPEGLGRAHEAAAAGHLDEAHHAAQRFHVPKPGSRGEGAAFLTGCSG
jgi:hypothetical protein